MISGLQLIEKEVSNRITDELNKMGILYRIFSRAKDKKSIEEKITRKLNDGSPYATGGKLMQDIIGIRVVTYFKDDIDIVYQVLKKKFNYIAEEIDHHELTVFKPKRTNIICRFKPEHGQMFSEIQKAMADPYALADDTFELQLRTMLSEGWHEIDHSLRYKCKDDWTAYHENERMLNGIYAALETNDIALKSLFNELAYKHYLSKNWEGLLRSKFRLQFLQVSLKPELSEILNGDERLAKDLFKVPRESMLVKISEMDFAFPLTFNNLLFIANQLYLNNEKINDVTPIAIMAEFN